MCAALQHVWEAEGDDTRWKNQMRGQEAPLLCSLLQCTMHNVQCTMHNAQCTMHNAQCTMHNAQCTMYNVQTAHCTMRSPHWMYPLQSLLCSATVESVSSLHSGESVKLAAQYHRRLPAISIGGNHPSINALQCNHLSINALQCITQLLSPPLGINTCASPSANKNTRENLKKRR